jgi:hypothetical protein
MPWYAYLAYFFAGAFFANAVPHMVNGISGRPFQSPFAKPRGEGLSSSTINVVWGWANLMIGYLLVSQVGSFDGRSLLDMLPLAVGALLMALVLARAFGRFHGCLIKG